MHSLINKVDKSLMILKSGKQTALLVDAYCPFKEQCMMVFLQDIQILSF